MALRQTFSLCLPTCPTVVLPGYDTKRWRRQLGTDGVLSLMGKTGRRTAHFVSQVGAYLGAGNYYIGRGAIVGSISDSAIVSERTIQGVRMTSPCFFIRSLSQMGQGTRLRKWTCTSSLDTTIRERR